MQDRSSTRHSRPTGCVLGGLAGVGLVSLCWPHLALATDAVWLLGLLTGAGAGVLVQALVHGLLVVSRRDRPGTRLLAQPNALASGPRRWAAVGGPYFLGSSSWLTLSCTPAASTAATSVPDA